MKSKIRLLKEWVNGETTYPEGQLLKISEEDSAALVKQGIAENYEAKKGDVIKVSPENGNLSPEELKAEIKSILAETNKDTKDTAIEKDGFAQQGGFRNISEFACAVKDFGVDVPNEKLTDWSNYVLKAPTGMGELVSSDGGFLVPTEFRNTLLKDSLEAAIVRPRATVLPMATNSVKIPVVNESTRSGSVYGGIIVYRPSEGSSKTASAPKFGQVGLNLHKLVGLCYVTDELLQDSPITLQPLLSTMFSEAIAFQEDEDFINGSGANQALGILNAPASVSVTIETDQAAESIVTENIVKMWSRLKPRSAGNAIWLANPDCFPQLATLTMNIGTGGSTVGLVQSVAGAPGMTLMGRPLILTEHCQTVGTAGDLWLADFRQYLVGTKASGLEVASSIHLKFDQDETAFRFVMRYDGQPWEIAARTPAHGDNTLGSFVNIAVRE